MIAFILLSEVDIVVKAESKSPVQLKPQSNKVSKKVLDFGLCHTICVT